MKVYHRYWIIWYAIAVHVAWAALLLVSDVPTHTTPLHTLSNVLVSPVVLALGLIGAALLAVIGITQPDRWRAIYLTLPQQTLVVIAANGARLAAWSRQYADGVARPFAFILADQLPTIMLAAFHTVALLDIAGMLRWRR